MDLNKSMERYLEDLVRIDTCQPLGREQDAVDYIRREVTTWSGHCETTVLDHGNHRQSLILTCSGSKTTGGLAFVTHLDTVEISDRHAWHHDPLGACRDSGRLHGRGSSDMKSGAAIMLALAEYLVNGTKQLESPVLFCFTADEERDGTGAKALAESGLMAGIDAMIIPEPTGNRLAVSEKGALWLRFTVRGKAAHGSTPQHGNNAIDRAIDLLDRMRPCLDTETADPLLGRSSMTVTRFEAGIGTNIVPDLATLEFDLRTIPGVLHEEIIAEADTIAERLVSEHENLSIDLSVLNNRAAVGTDPADPFVTRLLREREHFIPDKEPAKGMAYYTDASQLVPAVGCPFVIMGPGEEALAHQVNESVSLAACKTTLSIFKSYLDHHCFVENES
ncbi:MAG TPA: M20 family metallopeptidase [Clostridiaceae bacterium]|nr:M20 family metallopeptidase [Clostridiaceae bacterium]